MSAFTMTLSLNFFCDKETKGKTKNKNNINFFISINTTIFTLWDLKKY